MKNVIIRSITGIIYIAIIVGAILAGSLWMCILSSLLAILAIDEFNRISDKNHIHPVLRVLDIIGGCAMIFAAYTLSSLNDLFIFAIFAYILYLIIRFVAPLYIHRDDPLSTTAHSMMGQMYTALPIAMLLCSYHISPNVVMLMFIMIWLNDTGAFCVGTLLGRHRLFERISPKKSWEGFLGGLAFAITAGIVAATYMPSLIENRSTLSMAIFGVIVAVMSTWGDLVESQIKRTLNIKDSGKLLPGHGGILDRIDSLLLVAPATLLYLLLS